MDGGQKAAVSAWTAGVIAVVIIIVVTEWIRAGTSAEAIKAGLSQDENGRWIKAELNKERGDDAR